MKYENSRSLQISKLTTQDIKMMFENVGQKPVASVAIRAEKSRLVRARKSSVIHVQGPMGVSTAGNVAWIKTWAEPGAVWCYLQAWVATLSKEPTTTAEAVINARALAIVGKHISDVLAEDISQAFEYSESYECEAIEFDVDAKTHIVTAAVPVTVSAPKSFEIESNESGTTLTAGVKSDAGEVRNTLLYQGLVSLLTLKGQE